MPHLTADAARPIFLAVWLGHAAAVVMFRITLAVTVARGAGLAFFSWLRAVRRDVAELAAVVALLHAALDSRVRALGGDVALLAAVVAYLRATASARSAAAASTAAGAAARTAAATAARLALRGIFRAAARR